MVIKSRVLENGMRAVTDEESGISYIHKEDVLSNIGLDKDKASAWKDFYDILKLCSESLKKEFLNVPEDKLKELKDGVSTSDYISIQSKYKPIETPIKYIGHEYIRMDLAFYIIWKYKSIKNCFK